MMDKHYIGVQNFVKGIKIFKKFRKIFKIESKF